MHQICRMVEQHRTADAANSGSDDLVPGRIFAPHSVVAEAEQVQAWWRRRNDRIARVFLPGPELVVRARRQARSLDASYASVLVNVSVNYVDVSVYGKRTH